MIDFPFFFPQICVHSYQCGRKSEKQRAAATMECEFHNETSVDRTCECVDPNAVYDDAAGRCAAAVGAKCSGKKKKTNNLSPCVAPSKCVKGRCECPEGKEPSPAKDDCVPTAAVQTAATFPPVNYKYEYAYEYFKD